MRKYLVFNNVFLTLYWIYVCDYTLLLNSNDEMKSLVSQISWVGWSLWCLFHRSHLNISNLKENSMWTSHVSCKRAKITMCVVCQHRKHCMRQKNTYLHMGRGTKDVRNSICDIYRFQRLWENWKWHIIDCYSDSDIFYTLHK